jgi:hypothetical protein
MTTIQDKLRAWARGKAMDEAPNDAKGPGWTRSILNPGRATHRAPVMPEDEMIRVDREVTALRERKPGHYQVIVRYYLRHEQDREIAVAMRGSRTWVRELRVAAEHYLEAKLE